MSKEEELLFSLKALVLVVLEHTANGAFSAGNNGAGFLPPSALKRWRSTTSLLIASSVTSSWVAHTTDGWRTSDVQLYSVKSPSSSLRFQSHLRCSSLFYAGQQQLLLFYWTVIFRFSTDTIFKMIPWCKLLHRYKKTRDDLRTQFAAPLFYLSAVCRWLLPRSFSVIPP